MDGGREQPETPQDAPNPQAGPDVRRTFDACKLRYETDTLWVDASASRPVIVWDGPFNEPNDHDLFPGVYASTSKRIRIQETQVYFLARNTGLESRHFYSTASWTSSPGREWNSFAACA